jgi:uncharacterized membrane protein YfhO
VGLYLEESKIYIKNGAIYFWYFDEEVFKSVYEKLADGVMTVHSDSDDVLNCTVTVPAGDEVLFTTIPYDEGWEVTVDGKPAEVVPVLKDTLLAVMVKEGEHEICFRYRPECVKQGLMLTVLGIVMFAFFCFTDWRAEKKMKAALAGIETPAGNAPEEPDPAAFEPAPETPTESNSEEN